MPMNDEMADTSPIGVALDLSSKEKVQRPLVGEELDESSTPLPALMVLNNEGILSSWWMVYSESVRQGTAYPWLAIVGSSQAQQQSQPNSPLGRATQQQQPAFGQSTLGNTKSPPNNLGGAFGQPSTPALGTISAPFGVAQSQFPWGTSVSTGGGAAPTGGAAFGKPAFGSATPLGGVAQDSAFGATGGLGNRPSPWGGATLSTATTTGSTFGQPGGLGMRTGSSLGVNNVAGTFGGNSVAPAPESTSGGFGSYAKAGGFASAASQGSGESVFGKANDNTSFNSGMDTDTSFGGTLGKPDQTANLLGTGGTGGFTLGSTFKGDGTAKDDAPKPENGAGNSFFDSEFGTSLEEAPKTLGAPEAGEADMEESGRNDGAASPTQPATADPQSTTPTTTPVQAKSPFPSTAPPVAGGLFGTQAQSTTTPASVQNSEPAAIEIPEDKVEEQERQSSPPNESPTSPRIKPEPEDEEWDLPSGVDKNLPEAPLPPNPTSKTSYAAGDSSVSSTSASKDIPDDAPLPPDFIPPKDIPRATTEAESDPTSEDDDDDEGLSDEGSGEDVAQDLSPITDPTQIFKITPESSFGGARDRSPVGGLFSKVQRQAPQQNAKPLFGEVGGKSVPMFPPPNKVQESPRSPSPVRLLIPAEVLRPESARSVSAPGIQTKWLNHRKASTIMSTPTTAETQPELLGDGTRKASTVIFTPSTSRSQREEQGFKRQAALRARELAEEEQDLSDREDEKVREELDTEVEATTTLAPFLAHQDYVGNINKPGIPGQIERVYRDINSMVDTLGLNARSLAAFIKGHEEMYKDDGGRTRSDLEEASDWVLIEIEDVGNLEGQLHTQLAESRVPDVQSLLDGCRDLQHHLVRLRHKQHDLQRTLVARTQPDAVDARRAAPLAAEQAALQHDLRRDFSHLLKRLADAEEAVSLLKAKLASSQSHHGKQAGRQKCAVPTVEAVLKTVLTMTAMAEKKSGDVDVLETQMRRLALTSATAAGSVNGIAHGASGVRSRDASPFATPPPPASSFSKSSRSMPRTPASGGSGSIFFTPGTGGGSFRSSSLLGSRGDGGVRSTPRKKMDAVTEEDVRVYREKMTRRKEVCGKLREVLSGGEGGRGGRKGRVRGLDDL